MAQHEIVIASKIVKVQNVFLGESGFELNEESLLSLFELPSDSISDINRINSLPLIKGGRESVIGGNYPVMPSLRLDMLDREYSEPMRDRNKNWVLHSQRPVLNAEDPPPKLVNNFNLVVVVPNEINLGIRNILHFNIRSFTVAN